MVKREVKLSLFSKYYITSKYIYGTLTVLELRKFVLQNLII